MRQLHPVGWSERFVASGVYLTYEDARPTGAVERWTVHELPDGAQIARVDRQGAGRDDVLLIEAWRSPPAEGGRVERFDLQAVGPARMRASYILYPDRLEFSLRPDGGDERHDALPLPDGALADPGGWLFAGEIAARAASRGPAAVVTVDPAAFQPLVTTRTARQTGVEPVTIGPETLAARVYNVEWTGGAPTTLWLDDHDVALRCMGGALTALLSQYVRRPESRRHD